MVSTGCPIDWFRDLTDHVKALEHVEYTVRAATSVLGDLTSKCPPAEACREAFDRMAKATIKMCQTTTGFGSQVLNPPTSNPTFHPQNLEKEMPQSVYSAGTILSTGGSRPPPQFDYNLKDLFPEANLPMARFGANEGSSSNNNNQTNAAGWLHQQANPNSSAQSFVYPSPATTNTSLSTSNPTSDTSSTQPTFRSLSYTKPSSPAPQQSYDPRLFPPTDPVQSYSTNTTTNPIPAINFNTTFNNLPATSTSATSDPADLDFDLSFLLNHSNTTLPPTYYTGDGGSGLSLGFDGRPDLTGQGEMPNLFGDFFFGGTGGGDLDVGGMEGMEYEEYDGSG